MHIEGYTNGEWILIDYGTFVVHVFTDSSRRFYDLERLWRDAERVEV
jgi:ribosome-associated protein